MKVLKFGGSSVAVVDRIQQVAGVVRDAGDPRELVVVVSALGGVTDLLARAAAAAARGDGDGREVCAEIESRHRAVVDELAPAPERASLHTAIGERVGELRALLEGASLVGECSPRTTDGVLSLGERLSTLVVAAALRGAATDAEPCDARDLVVTDDAFGGARVETGPTYERIRAHFSVGRPLQVVTGFIGATPSGETTTLGRGGSDYTAALVGAALEADAVELWTDVDGVMSADPRRVSQARTVPELGYEELMELSHFGAKVVYPPSLHPIRAGGIPLVIRNTLHPERPGTRVVAGARAAAGPRLICGISSIPDVALLRLEGDGMVGMPGIAERLFGSLARRGISVILITQASSEHSICFAVAPQALAAAERCVNEEFVLERGAGLIDAPVIESEMAVVAVVGAGMRERPGIAGRLFGVLGDYGINVRAIAQGSSELNISFVVAAADEPRTLNVIHEAFYTPHRRSVDLGLAGVGRVGAALLTQIHEQREALERQYGLRLRVTGVTGSRGALIDPTGLDCAGTVARLREGPQASFAEFLDSLTAERWPKKVFVDCTASAEVAQRYEELLGAGVSVVTANKLRLAGELAAYRGLLAAGPGRLFYETTVGAGLPVIRTLGDLIATGDHVTRIDGLLSGTLGFVTAELAAGRPFSEIVRRAHDHGYTEPDPREDLFGSDVGRKLVILGRLAGMDLEPEQVAVEPLLPDASWRELTLDEFWARLPELDEGFARRQTEAQTRGERLCYLGTLAGGKAEVRLRAVGPGHACWGARGTDNVIAFTTDRYHDNPLVVQGPGAGPEVTAAGVLADILRAVVESG